MILAARKGEAPSPLRHREKRSPRRTDPRLAGTPVARTMSAFAFMEVVMKRSRMRPHGPRPGRPVQVFTCGPFEFHVDKAQRLAAAEKYRPERRMPNPEWVNPFIDIDEGHVEETNLVQPVLFATLITDGQPWHLLIDGNHRVLKALRHGVAVQAITLDLMDTLKIVRGSHHAVEQMRRDGERLGLLSGRKPSAVGMVEGGADKVRP
jgi:hypothetical protein